MTKAFIILILAIASLLLVVSGCGFFAAMLYNIPELLVFSGVGSLAGFALISAGSFIDLAASDLI